MSLPVSALQALREFILARQAAARVAPEQKMLQGVYRGYAGGYDTSQAAEDSGLIYATPQRRAAELYAASRSAQAARRGADPTQHLEMILIDPATGRRYGHSTMGTGANPPMRTLAAELQPEDIKSVAQLYARGGLAQLKQGCSCHG